MKPKASLAIQKMRILIVSEDLPAHQNGGLGKHALLLARALFEAGHEVDLMGNAEVDPSSLSEPMSLPGRFYGVLSGAHTGWKERALGCFVPMRRALTARRFARNILRHARGYDVIHYHGHVPDVAAFIPSDINFVQTRHDQGADCLIHTRFKSGEICAETEPVKCATCVVANPNWTQRLLSAMSVKQYRKRTALGFKRHKTVFVSDMLRRNLTRTFGGKPDDWGAVVHNFVDWQAMASHLSHEYLGDSWVTVLVTGKVYPPKGIGLFLDLFVPTMPARMRIVVAGDGPEEPRLRETYSSANVEFLGWCDYREVLARTAVADVVVVPSVLEEACATTVLEALGFGRLVFALNRGGTPELAVYQRTPGQLRLFDDLPALVSALLASASPSCSRTSGNYLADVRFRLPELMKIYAQPTRRPA